MGALDLTADAQATQQILTLACNASQRVNIPHANTIGRGAAGHRFKITATALFIVLLICGSFFPLQTLLTALLAFTALIFTQAMLRIAAICLGKTKFEIADNSLTLACSGTQTWPLYTVLVPLKDEAHMVAGLIETLSRLNYPTERLQIIFITEEDDPETCRAVAAALRAPFEHVIVPRHGAPSPRTKPNALNVAMKTARGAFVTIYDAEDAPDPEQLKTAIIAFKKHPNWGALQAPLDYFNTRESWLAAQFGLEYAAQFHVWIPLMVRLGLPFPLGGTSNHIRRSALESVRRDDLYWDSYNVTEDADLSFRLSAHGWDIGYITPPTQEEAVSTLKPWTQQRTRWMKGFMQSWRVHMDSPFTPGGWRGIKRQITLQLTLGSVLLAGFFHAPICAALLIWIVYSWLTTGTALLSPLVGLSLSLGYGTGLIMGAFGALRAKKLHLLWSLPLMPLYWMCLCVPTYRAAYEYFRNPYYWAKTAHGKSSQLVGLNPAPRKINSYSLSPLKGASETLPMPAE